MSQPGFEVWLQTCPSWGDACSKPIQDIATCGQAFRGAEDAELSTHSPVQTPLGISPPAEVQFVYRRSEVFRRAVQSQGFLQP